MANARLTPIPALSLWEPKSRVAHHTPLTMSCFQARMDLSIENVRPNTSMIMETMLDLRTYSHKNGVDIYRLLNENGGKPTSNGNGVISK